MKHLKWLSMLRFVIAAIFIFPLVFMISGSLRSINAPLPTSFDVIPLPLVGDNYLQILALTDIEQGLGNSLLVSMLAVPLAVVCASWVAFALVRLQGKASQLLLVLTALSFLVPPIALIVGRSVVFRWLWLADTIWPLVLPGLIGVTTLSVLLYYWGFRRISRTLFEAGDLEGASPLMVWRGIAMPLVKPITVVVALLAFVTTWNDFLTPLTTLNASHTYTAPLVLRSLAALDRSDYPLFLAGSVVVTLPVIVVTFMVFYFFKKGWKTKN